MLDFQHAFIEFALAQKALKFGEFTLKSGRISPYFFNAGAFQSGYALAKLGEFYAQAIEAVNLEFDMLFGPAYKGIPLACSTAISFAKDFNKDYPYAFNRKEIKDHGEGGQIVGAALKGRVLLIDDVITAGTAFRESLTLFENTSAKICAIVIALNRQERGQNNLSAIEEIQQQYQIPVLSIIKLEDLIDYLNLQNKNTAQITAMEAYKKRYGA